MDKLEKVLNELGYEKKPTDHPLQSSVYFDRVESDYIVTIVVATHHGDVLGMTKVNRITGFNPNNASTPAFFTNTEIIEIAKVLWEFSMKKINLIKYLIIVLILSFGVLQLVEIKNIQSDILKETKHKNEIDLDIWDMRNKDMEEVDERINFLWTYFYEKLGHDLPAQPS